MKGETVYDTGKSKPDGSTTILDNAEISSVGGSDTSECTEDICYEKGTTILDTYRVESDAIVSGGMGRVWRVHHTGWNVDLAMKRPRAEFFSGEKSKLDFINECDTWIKLGLHPNIVSCYYVRLIDDIPTIFSEWMDGGDLAHTINSGNLYEDFRENPAQVQKRILDIAIQFARGLYYAHESLDESGKPQNLIHRDVKPGNVLLSKSGEVKVSDFGLTKSVTRPPQGAPAGDAEASCFKGTLAYCSMEQMDEKPLTQRTDLYSWAVSVMELYVGSHPWTNGVVAGLNCPQYFSEAPIPIPAPMTDLLERCLASEPDDRPHDFGLVIAELRAIYRMETGEDYPREASKAAADTADSLNNRALSMLDLGKPEEAEKLWERACLVSNSTHPESVYNQNLHLWRTGRINDIHALSKLRAVDAPELLRSCERECLQLELLFRPKFATKSRDVEFAGIYTRNGYDFALLGDNLSSFYHYNLESGVCTFTVHSEKKPRLRGLYIDEENNCFYATSNDIYCYSLTDGVLIRKYYAGISRIQKFLVNKERGLIFCIGNYGNGIEYILWGMDDTMPKFVKQLSVWFGVDSLWFSSDGTRILLNGRDQVQRILSVATGDLIETITEDEQTHRVLPEEIKKPTLSEPPLRLEYIHINTTMIQIVDVNTGRSMKTLEGRPSFTYLSEDGKYVVVAKWKRMPNIYRILASKPASWALSRVHSHNVVKKEQDTFNGAIEDCKQAIDRLDISAALAALEFARSLPGKASDLACVELNKVVGAYCKKSGLHGIYSRNTFKTDNHWITWMSFVSGSMHILTFGEEKKLRVWSAEGRLLKEYKRELSYEDIKTLPVEIRQAVLMHRGVFDQEELVTQLNQGNVSKKIRIERLIMDGTHAITKLANARYGGYCLTNLSTNETEIVFASSHANCIQNSFIEVPEIGLVFIEYFHLYESTTGDRLHSQFGFERFNLATGELMEDIALPLDRNTNTLPSAIRRCYGRFWFWSVEKTIYAYEVDTKTQSELQIKSKQYWPSFNVLPIKDGSFLFVHEHDDLLQDLEGSITIWNTLESREIYRLQGPSRYIEFMDISNDDNHLLTRCSDGSVTILAIDWAYSFPGWSDWDEGVRPHLEIFLSLHPHWEQTDFEELILRLQNCGFGWVRPDGVKQKLLEMRQDRNE